jgi:hypothetical protein
MTKHKHHDLICAWARGERIQIKNFFDLPWGYDPNPYWYDQAQYRIEPKPNVIRTASISQEYGYVVLDGKLSDNISLTFDGETNELISVEMIKND